MTTPVNPVDLRPGERVKMEVEGVMDDSGWLVVGDGELAFDGPTLALATITRLPPPVDRDRLLARKVCAEMWPKWAEDYLSGNYDNGGVIYIALAAIKAAKEETK